MTDLSDIITSLDLSPPSFKNDQAAAILSWTREMAQSYMTANYAVTDTQGIEELKCVNIGGVSQWLHIRGRNKTNPILLYIHGGPGASMIGFMDAIQRPWEDYFTVVQWDQRGTGKSYSHGGEDASLNVKRHIEDASEVIEYLRSYFQQNKLFVLGHSWGSVIGMHIVKRHPEKLHAYIGVGQVVNMVAGEQAMLERLMVHAKNNHEHDIVAKLEEITDSFNGGFPKREICWAKDGVYVRKELSRLARETLMRHTSWDDFLKIWCCSKLLSPHLTLAEVGHSLLGDERPTSRPPYTFGKEFLDVDLPNQIGSSFKAPIFFLSGSHDWQTPVTLSDEWFTKIRSTYKELIHFKESSHMIINEEPGRFFTALVTKVLPLAAHNNLFGANNG